ncbi:hypothetical protein MKX03_019873, partial [Papaver bracteatum]
MQNTQKGKPLADQVVLQMEQQKTPRYTAETEFFSHPNSPSTQQTPRTLRRLNFS